MHTTLHPKLMQPLQTRVTWDPSSLFAASHSGGTKSPCCRVRDALRQDKQKPYII